jgi:hypothetical protein
MVGGRVARALGSSSPRSRGPRVDQGDGNDEDEAQIAEHDRARPSFVRIAVIGSEVLSQQARNRSADDLDARVAVTPKDMMDPVSVALLA